MITPTDIEKIDLKKYDLDKLEMEIDDSIKLYHGWYPYEYASILTELPRAVRNEISKRYMQAGWKYVYHTTTSETGERAGLTCFKFSMVELHPNCIEGFILYKKYN